MSAVILWTSLYQTHICIYGVAFACSCEHVAAEWLLSAAVSPGSSQRKEQLWQRVSVVTALSSCRGVTLHMQPPTARDQPYQIGVVFQRLVDKLLGQHDFSVSPGRPRPSKFNVAVRTSGGQDFFFDLFATSPNLEIFGGLRGDETA